MGKSLSELDLKDEPLPTQSYDELPEFGGFAAPPQPGPYRFKLPGALAKLWDVFDTQKGQRVRLVFDRDNPLLIVQSPGGKMNNETFQTRISNAERRRGKEGPEVSDLDYLLRALGLTTRPQSNRAYIEATNQHGGDEFSADVTWNWTCSKERDIRAIDADGTPKAVEGTKGCGKRYYQRDIASLKNADGSYPEHITCECGASLRAFANLDNIRA